MLHTSSPHRCAVWASVDPDDPEGTLVCEDCGAPLPDPVTSVTYVGRGCTAVLPIDLCERRAANECGCIVAVDEHAIAEQATRKRRRAA
jgi:hypothetical protein